MKSTVGFSFCLISLPRNNDRFSNVDARAATKHEISYARLLSKQDLLKKVPNEIHLGAGSVLCFVIFLFSLHRTHVDAVPRDSPMLGTLCRESD